MYPGNINSNSVGGKKTEATNKQYYSPNTGVIEYARGIPPGAIPQQLGPNNEMIQTADPTHPNYLGQLQLMHLQQAAPMEFLAYNNQIPGYGNPAMMKKQAMGSVPLVQSPTSHISNAEQASERSLGRGRAKKTRGKKRKPVVTKPASRKSSGAAQGSKRVKKDSSDSKWNDAEDDANVDEETRRERKNEREKQRRQEISTQFQNLVNILDIPKNSGADKVTILAKAVETIKALKNALIASNAAKAGYYMTADPRTM